MAVLAGKSCVLRGSAVEIHADTMSVCGSPGTQGVGIEEGMPYSPPSGGKPIC